MPKRAPRIANPSRILGALAAPTDGDAPTSVLDASALLALLLGEEGKTVVAASLARRSAISIVNWTEVLSKAAEKGEDPIALDARYRSRGFVGDALTIEPVTAADSTEAARLRPLTRSFGLSLADRVCIALASRLGVPVLSADRNWAKVHTDVEVRLIR